ncbi:MAG: hypothetical protein AAFY56_24825, partial [Pseudomonadota bacterium]
DVLGQLRPGDYKQHTIWTTLEPCLLCSTAIVMSNVGIVRFAAQDRLWNGLTRLPELNEFVAERWPNRIGPMTGPIATFCEVLPLIWFVKNKPRGTVVSRYGTRNPKILELAQHLAQDARFKYLESETVDATLAELWPELERFDSPAFPPSARA